MYVRLDTGPAGGGRVLLITAAAGTGKTVLIAGWAGTHLPRSYPGTRIGWLTATPTGATAGELRHAVPASLGIDDIEPVTDPDTAAAQVISALRADDRPRVLVVDDAHLLTDPGDLAYLQRLLTDAPPNLTAVLSARHDPPLRWHAVDLRRRVFRLHAVDLAFSEIRAAQLCRQHHCPLTGTELAMLMGLTRGWPALVRIAAGRLAAHDDRSTALTELAEAPAPIADFLADEVLAPLPDRIRRFVRITSVPGSFTGALAERLTGDIAVPVLHELVRAGFPMTRHARDGDLWFTYHPLMRAHLLGEARRCEDMTALQLRTADSYLSAGLPRSALHHLLRAPAASQLRTFLRDTGLRMVLDGDGPDLFRQLDQSDAVPPDDPLVRVLRAIDALEQRDIGKAMILLDKLYRRPAGTGAIVPDSWIRLLATAAGAGVTLATGAGLAEFRFPDRVFVTGQPDVDGYAALQFGTVALAHGDIERAERQFRRGRAQAGCAGCASLSVRAEARLAVAALIRGTVTGMREHAGRAVAAAARSGRTATGDALGAQAVSAFSRYLRGETTGSEIDTTATHSGDWDEVVAHLLEFDRSDDRYTAAETLRRSTVVMLRTPLPLPAAAGRLLPHVVRVLLAVDAGHSARLLVDQAADVLGESADVVLARAATTLAHRPATTSAMVAPLLATAAAAQPLTTAPAWLLEAAAQAALGNPPRARRALATAVHHAAPEGLVRPFLDVPGAAELLDAHIGTLGHDNDFAAAVRAHPALRRQHRPPSLTATELTVLNQLPSGRTAQQIADVLGVSINTVKTHLRGIYGKLGTSTRAGALELARRTGLL
nr:LuxR C-terminal-related transcriptional regulator [Nocardia transvalensis]